MTNAWVPCPDQHCFSVDVEEYFHANALEAAAPRAQWDRLPSRVEASTDLLLQLLARHGQRGTFFAVGWVAERHPALIQRIVAAGHEIASHSWWHRRVTALNPQEFREDIRASKAILEEVSGTPVVGFRAPSFSIVPGLEWAFDILLEEGYRYDSSLFPIRRPDYGYPTAPSTPHWLRRPAGQLLELPLTTIRLAGVRFPAAGGGYFRHFPYALFRHAFRSWGRAGVPGMFYIHPWEVDPEQPRYAVGPLTRLRHYGGLSRTLPLLERLLAEFRFTSIAKAFAPILGPGDAGARAAVSLP